MRNCSKAIFRWCCQIYYNIHVASDKADMSMYQQSSGLTVNNLVSEAIASGLLALKHFNRRSIRRHAQAHWVRSGCAAAALGALTSAF